MNEITISFIYYKKTQTFNNWDDAFDSLYQHINPLERDLLADVIATLIKGEETIADIPIKAFENYLGFEVFIG